MVVFQSRNVCLLNTTKYFIQCHFTVYFYADIYLNTVEDDKKNLRIPGRCFSLSNTVNTLYVLVIVINLAYAFLLHVGLEILFDL